MSDLRDEYGNPISSTGYGDAGGHEVGYGAAAHPEGVTSVGGQTRTKEELHRSGSSSSSSSEDDGAGGRRKKKGLKEKIKEKLPGHKAEQQQQHEAGYAQQSTQHEPHEKKGIMEKIKEKMPGHH
ncbi:hypothetical protein Taro_046150 [Colocasia esculenta]|uniref:Dehydrin 1 n=1 Tax=Colocasia esculenta TaxID=4460 RepID=A0A843X584_COLES|nr:hypothetical protein [Colocasia esculenta]